MLLPSLELWRCGVGLRDIFRVLIKGERSPRFGGRTGDGGRFVGRRVTIGDDSRAFRFGLLLRRRRFGLSVVEDRFGLVLGIRLRASSMKSSAVIWISNISWSSADSLSVYSREGRRRTTSRLAPSRLASRFEFLEIVRSFLGGSTGRCSESVRSELPEVELERFRRGCF